MLRRRVLTVTALLTLPSLAGAATLTWPGAAPCNASLQACIDAAAPGDVVQIDTDAPIASQVNIQKPLGLRAAPGRRPVIAGDIRLEVPDSAPPGEVVINVDGLDIHGGTITAIHFASRSARIRLRGNTIRSGRLGIGEAGVPAVEVLAGSSSALVLEVVGNLIDPRSPVPAGPGNPGLRIDGAGSGYLTAHLAFNRIPMRNAPSFAAVDVSRPAGSSELYVSHNRIEGSGFRHGFLLRSGTEGPLSTTQFMRFMNNVVVGQGGSGEGAALSLVPNGGSLSSEVFTNTFTHGQRGLLATGLIDMLGFHYNLVAYNDEDVLVPAGGDVQYDTNLAHGNRIQRLAGTTGLVTGSPRLQMDGFRLRAGSAAIDAISGETGMTPFAQTDIDGLPRLKGGFIDIGAHEWGARHLLHRAGPGNTVLHATDLSQLQGEPAANPLLTQNWNPGDIGGIYNNQPVGVYYFEGVWRVFNENIAPMPAGAAFNVFVPGSATPGHLSAPANTFDGASLIDREGLNGNPDAFVLATHHWNGHGSPGQYMDTRWGIAYLGGFWNLIDLEAPFPYQRGFNLHVQSRSGSAFLHVSDASNTAVNWTTIDHPLLNGTPCALLQVTPRTDGSFPPSQQLGVWYTGERWAVFHQGSAAMPAGVQMHVLFDPAQVESCSRERIFADGVEDRPPRPW
jgi:hypothetical protein